VSFRNTGTIQEIMAPLKSTEKNCEGMPDLNGLKSALYDMVSDVRDHWRCNEGHKRKLDQLVKEMVVGV
jgi:hypothetical protein